jgi:hypothetical protein
MVTSETISKTENPLKNKPLKYSNKSLPDSLNYKKIMSPIETLNQPTFSFMKESSKSAISDSPNTWKNPPPKCSEPVPVLPFTWLPKS